MSDSTPLTVPDMTQIPSSSTGITEISVHRPPQPQPLPETTTPPPLAPAADSAESPVVPPPGEGGGEGEPAADGDPCSPSDTQRPEEGCAKNIMCVEEGRSDSLGPHRQLIHADSELKQDPLPADEEPAQGVVAPVTVSVPQMPQVSLTFLLECGKRRTMSFEPETTVGRVKELAWNAWPSEWQDFRPPAPSYLRILHLGKILQDEDTLSKLAFPTSIPSASQSQPIIETRSQAQAQPTATIVHLSIRPYVPLAEGELKKKGRKRRARNGQRDGGLGNGGGGEEEGGGGGDNSAGCCGGCVVC